MRASSRARESHGDATPAVLAWREHGKRRARIEENLSSGYRIYAFPSRHLKPSHVYPRMVDARLERGGTFRIERTPRADSQEYRARQRLTTNPRGRERPAPTI